jgi:hypothetical protein
MRNSNINIQRIEMESNELPLHCPVCGQCILTGNYDKQDVLNPCKHTLFIANDEGFEYRSNIFHKTKGIEGAKLNQIDIDDQGYDRFTDSFALKNTIKFAFYEPAPSFFGVYVGFIFDE